ncbi:MAG: beta strand repeat-containing protein, partial [Planctomycetia bacterium]
LDLANLTLTRDGSVTATAGRLTNGVLTGSAGLTKSGGGTFRIDSTANTFMGATAIQDGVVEVPSIAAAGVASSLGSGTGANATINLGNLGTSGTLRYIGTTSATTNRTLNLSGTTGGGAIENDGDGALVMSSAVTVANGSKTLALGGTGTAANTIGAIGEPGTGDLSVVKDGPGLWRLTGVSTFEGGLTVRNGTVVATVNSGGGTDAGVFGKADNLTVGNSAVGATGTATLLLAPGVISDRVLKVPSTTGGQAVVLGGEAAGTTSEFRNAVWLGRAVTLVAATNGTTTFGNTWAAESGSGTTEANVTIGAAGSLGTVRLGNNLTTSGSVGVRFGTLNVDDSKTLTAAGIVGIDSGATLAGVGTVAATLGGAGFVAPGNSPGILTAQSVNPTAGLDFNFEFTGTAPIYGTGTASINDILRLTGTAASPFTTALTSANEIAVYLDVASLADGNTFRGGFFTDLASDFKSRITDATYTYWVSGTGAGQTTYLTKTYVPLASLYPSLSMDVTTVSDTATFSGGSPTSGQVMQFTVVVPEPGTLALAALGLGLAGWAIRRRRAA